MLIALPIAIAAIANGSAWEAVAPQGDREHPRPGEIAQLPPKLRQDAASDLSSLAAASGPIGQELG